MAMADDVQELDGRVRDVLDGYNHDIGVVCENLAVIQERVGRAALET